MEINKISERNIIFSQYVPDGWNLNMHLIKGDSYNYIIDSGLGTEDIDEVLEYIKDDKKRIVLINTHYHWDHIWGNSRLKDEIIISHRLCKQIIDEKWDDMISKNKQYIHGETEKCLPNITFEEELYFEEDKIRITYTPGHTVDGICIFDEVDRVLNVGDNIGDDMDNLVPHLVCSIDEYVKSLNKYLEYDFVYCVSGHNKIVEKNTIQQILELVKQGESK